MSTPIQLRRDVASNWTTKNPILLDGEVGIEKDTKKLKIGDGLSDWNALAYVQTQGAQGVQGLAGSGLSVGDMFQSVRNPGAGYLLCDGSVYAKADYPDLSPLLDNTSSYLDNTSNFTKLSMGSATISNTMSSLSTQVINVSADGTGTYFAIMQTAYLGNRIEVFKRTGETIAHIPNAITGITITASAANRGLAISPDGNYMVLSCNSTSHAGSLFLLKRSGDTFAYLSTLVATSSTNSDPSGEIVSFSPDGTYFASSYHIANGSGIWKLVGDVATQIYTGTTSAYVGAINWSNDSKICYFGDKSFTLNGTSVTEGYQSIGLTSGGASISITNRKPTNSKYTFPALQSAYATLFLDGTYRMIEQYAKFPILSQTSGIVMTDCSLSYDNKLVTYTRANYVGGQPSVFIYKLDGDVISAGPALPDDPSFIRRAKFVGQFGEYLAIASNLFPFLHVYRRGLSYDTATHFQVPNAPKIYSGAFELKNYIRAL